MSLFVLDTDTLSLYERKHPIVVPKVQAVKKDELAVTVITVEEQLSGWYRLLRQAKSPPQLARAYQRLADTVAILVDFRILSLTESAIQRYAGLKALKLGVGGSDLRIAAIVLESNATVVTRNLRDFQRVPGLVIDNWAV